MNVLVLLMLTLGAEIVLGTWLRYDARTEGVTCYGEVLHHSYCPGIVHRNFMAKADGGAIVDTFVDRSGIEVASYAGIGKETNSSTFDVVLIGDSFLQADEIAYEERLSALLQRQGVNALQVGYSSWAPLIMRNWLNSHTLKPGAHVYLMAMTNDFLESYRSSDLAYSKQVKAVEDGISKFTVTPAPKIQTPEWQAYIQRNSYFLSRWKLAREALASQAAVKKSTEPLIVESAFEQTSESCDPLPKYRMPAANTPALAMNYFEFSRPESCWSEATRSATAKAVETIREIGKDMQKKGVRLTVLLIPAGWAFPEENVAGKQSPVAYRMARETVVTQAGLSKELSARLEGMEFIDLEPVIRDLKRGDGENWYFPSDGHWTAHAHERLAQWLAKHHAEGK